MVLDAETIPNVIEALVEVIHAAKDVFFKDSFSKLSASLLGIIPILEELNKKNVYDSQVLNNALEILDREVKEFKKVVLECSKRSKVYQFVKYRFVSKRIEDINKEIIHALSLISLASLDVSASIRENVNQLCDSMRAAEFKTATAYEDILDKIDSGIQERNIDRANAYKLALMIGQAVGISTQTALKQEFEGFKTEIEDAKLRKDQAEAIQMEQIIALLERGDATSSFEEKEKKYISKRNSLGTQPLEPLQSFYCPITREVMEDPVETSSGQTFERKAIEEWLASGSNLCPMTNIVLETPLFRPNKTLRQSIEEWKDRNTMISIASMRPKLLSGDVEEIIHCLEELQDLCEQRDIHREWVILENYIPVLVSFLRAENRDIRTCALVILHILSKNNDDTKEIIAKSDDALESIVRSLGRRDGKLAVALLLELSKNDSLRQSIGKVKGCIIYLVTMSNSTDSQSARDARDLLQNLSFSDENVIQMAKTNYFEHLLERLSSGPADVQLKMARTLAEMDITDHYKSSLFEQGVLHSLLQLMKEGDDQMKEVAVKALRNLSDLPQNGWHMIRQGSVSTLLSLLYHPSSSTSLREQAAATIMHLAISTTVENTGESPVSLFESDDEINTFFSCIILAVPEVQESILRSFQAICQSPSASNVMKKLNQSTSIQVLVQLCELDDHNVRVNAVKLLYCLTEYGTEDNIMEHLSQNLTETLTRIIMTSIDSEEIASAMGIISNLTVSPQISEWLLEAEGLSKILDHLCDGRKNGQYKNQLIENALAAICRFTAPENLQLQKMAAEKGIIPVLVELLEQGTSLTKRRAATSLAQFSKSTPALTKPIPRRHALWCFSAQAEAGCPVHAGFCTVESSFCLVEAGAVASLVRLLGVQDTGLCEASLDALLTLIQDPRLKSGSKVLDEARAIPCMIKLLNVPSPPLQEKVLSCLERMFTLQELRQKYGGSSQMPLVELTQRGHNTIKSSAARILAQLNVLHEQSSYF
ncbi:hypothetical protein DCAR_0624035 [Daucus carota subsp. sativus]|uniref:RING-type E3 ubiquitin transferase n=1 Tax=Daucus carota subsp. sativus TaxID=79200 RepID=A0A164VL58_DAUCS|nr:PREDICTED: U-box domain-containing protein 44-like [Daucus carota subsp. sativus]WOH04624.1 hypothetical protein DCAR_0624035 [Daucus carota subsp. sativus]